MLGFVRVWCPGCGDIEVQADGVTIRACVEVAQNTYRFHCDRCDTLVIKDAGQSTVRLLLRAGVRVDPWDSSAGLGSRAMVPRTTSM